MVYMKAIRSTAARSPKRPSSIISRIRAHQRGVSGTPHLFGSVGGVDAATGNSMLSTPYFLNKPTLLT